MKTFFLIDGFAFLYRAYYAVPEMKNFEGVNMNAVYGFLRMILKRFSKRPDYLVIARDSPEKTFRHEQSPDYKAHRKKMEDDFKDQIPILRQIIEDLGIPSVAVP
jgi:DNA polymerase-1